MERSEIMRRVKSRDTSPEIAVRKELHAKGFRFRLKNDAIAGRPDLTFRRQRAAVFVNGCFWHWHGCKRSRMPKANRGYWEAKIAGNVARDQRNYQKLDEEGWTVFVIWECDIRFGLEQLESYLLA